MFIAITSRSCNGSAVRIKLSKPSGKIWLNWNWTKTKRKNPLDHCATLPRIKLGGKLLYSKYYFREILPTDAVWSWWSYIYHEFKDILFAVVAVNFPPSSPPPPPERDIHRTTSPTSLRPGFVKNTLTIVFTISRITFTVIKLSVDKEVLLKVLPQIQSRRQLGWQKWNLFISYGGNFRRHFGFFILNLRSVLPKSARACHMRWHRHSLSQN